MQERGFQSSFQKQLVSQLIHLDERKGTLLCIDYSGKSPSHRIYDLRKSGNISLRYVSQTLPLTEGSGKRENYISQVGVDITFPNGGEKLFLVVYDHEEHNIYLKDGLEKQALALKEKIESLMKMSFGEA